MARLTDRAVRHRGYDDSFNPLSSRWPVSQLRIPFDWFSGYVSIRFHRGGPSHVSLRNRVTLTQLSFNPLSSRWPVSQNPAHDQVHLLKVSIRFHRGGPSHTVRAAVAQLLNSVSIRFHRGGPSHGSVSKLHINIVVFQSAFIAVARLTNLKLVCRIDRSVSIRFHRGGPSHASLCRRNVY